MYFGLLFQVNLEIILEFYDRSSFSKVTISHKKRCCIMTDNILLEGKSEYWNPLGFLPNLRKENECEAFTTQFM